MKNIEIRKIKLEALPCSSIDNVAKEIIQLQELYPKLKSIEFEFNSVAFEITSTIKTPSTIVEAYYKNIPRVVII